MPRSSARRSEWVQLLCTDIYTRNPTQIHVLFHLKTKTRAVCQSPHKQNMPVWCFHVKCAHLHFKWNTFPPEQPCPLKEKPVSPCLSLCFYPPPPSTEFLTLVHSLIAVTVEPKPSHVGALDRCTPSEALFLCVGLWSASHLEGKAGLTHFLNDSGRSPWIF